MGPTNGEPMTGLEPMLRMADVVRILNIGRRTFERLVASREFPPPDRKAGRVPLWTPATVRGWISCEAAPKPKRR